MSLALAIPVKDDHDALACLVQQAAGLGIFDQIVVVDDGSQRPVALPAAGPCLTLLRNAAPRGPGVARNMALEQVTSTYVVYADSDDRLTDDLPALWKSLRHQTFDLCLFRYHDTRQEQAGRWGQLPQDDALWHRAGPIGADPQEIGSAARACLAETANYPWNKIYRVAFLRDKQVRCAETLVHEDIQLHWLALLEAGRVLASARVGAVHRVSAAGDRLTNLRSARRLEVFTVLQDVLRRLVQGRAAQDLILPFLRFVAGLLDWIHMHLDDTLLAAFTRQRARFLGQAVTPDIHAEVMQADPVLALRLSVHMAVAGRPVA